MVIIKEKGNTRHEHDYYPTPIEYCRATIEYTIPKDFKPAFICDAGAGMGAWGKAINEFPNLRYSYLEGVDQFQEQKIEGYDSWYAHDYLSHVSPFGNYDLIIGNPPYNLIEEFIRHSLDILNDEGYLVFLMRLSMLESQKRGRGMWRETPLKSVWVSVRRISFTGDGQSDDTAYGTFVWKRGFKGVPTIHWLDWEYAKNNKTARA